MAGGAVADGSVPEDAGGGVDDGEVADEGARLDDGGGDTGPEGGVYLVHHGGRGYLGGGVEGGGELRPGDVREGEGLKGCGTGRVTRPDRGDPVLRALRCGGDGTCVPSRVLFINFLLGRAWGM